MTDMDAKMCPPWHREPCHECGIEELATRGEAAPQTRFLCEVCETVEKCEEAHRKEVATLERELAEARTERDALRAKLEVPNE